MRFAFVARTAQSSALLSRPRTGFFQSGYVVRFTDAVRKRPKRSARTREGPRCKRFMGAHARPVKEAPGRTAIRGLAVRDDRPVSEALADRQDVQAAAAARGSGRLRRAFKRPACLDRSPSCRKRALSALCLALRPRRGGRVVECTALEMRHTGNRIGGSNPSLSARSSFQKISFHPNF
jgi:hypothetical protein